MKSKLAVFACSILFIGAACQANENRAVDTSSRMNSVSGTTESAETSTTTSESETKAETKSANKNALEAGRHYLVVSFLPGSDSLSQSEKDNLKSLVDKAQANNQKIQKIHVVAWSDKAFPAGKKASDLPKADRDLAKKRLEAINSYLKTDLKVGGIKDYNMAQRSSWFARAFNTKDAELKSLFAQKGAPSDVAPEQFMVVRDNGGPSKAVILIQEKGEKMSKNRRAYIGTHLRDTNEPASENRSDTDHGTER